MILIDGFDHDDAVDVWTGSTGFNVQTTTKRTGTRAAQQGTAGGPTPGIAYRALGPSEIDDGVTMGGAFFLASADALSGFQGGVVSTGLWVGEDFVIHLTAQFRNDLRSIELWLGSPASGTRLAFTDPNLFTFDTWHYLELGCKIHDSAGSGEVRLNGATVLSVSGVDTRNGGALGVVNKMGFTGGGDVGSAQNKFYDDFYLLNEQGSAPWNTFLQDTRVFPLYPDGNGNYSQLVGSDADSTDNYLLVDEVGTPSSADYVASAVDGEKDSYTFENMPVSVGTIRAVETRLYAAKSETGTRQMRSLIRRSATDANGADHVLAELAYATYRDIFEQDPHAGPGVWTITNVDGTEFGAEVRP